MTWGAVAGTVIGGVMQRGAAKKAAAQQQAAAAQAAGQAEFSPYDVFGAFGQTQFDPETGQARMIASPEMAALQGLFGQQAQQFAGQQQTPMGALAAQGGLGFLTAGMETDPFALAETQFGRMEEILAPGRERQRGTLEERLLAQGRLGSTGGSLQQQSLEEAIEQSRRAQLVEALGQAQGIQQQQIGLGTQLGLFGQGQEDVGFQRAMQRLGGMQSLEQPLMQYAQLGSQLGGRQAAAGAQAGAFGLQGAQAGIGAQLGSQLGIASQLPKIGTAIGGMFDTTDAGAITTQTPYGAATMSNAPASTEWWRQL
jgi:hypothetical protein